MNQNFYQAVSTSIAHTSWNCVWYFLYYIFDRLIEIDRVTACIGRCLIALRDHKTAKYFSREAIARRGVALVSAMLRQLFAVWFVAKFLNNEWVRYVWPLNKEDMIQYNYAKHEFADLLSKNIYLN